MKKTSYSNWLNIIARNNGYIDKFEMFRDFNLIPTVLTPKHRKSEFVILLYRYFKQCVKKR